MGGGARRGAPPGYRRVSSGSESIIVGVQKKEKWRTWGKERKKRNKVETGLELRWGAGVVPVKVHSFGGERRTKRHA